jgi:RNA polymerase sigma factor (sigma-70 family)
MLLLIQGCKRNDRDSQRLLHKQYYGYAMSICVRYCRTQDEAKEALNDGFLKVFTRIDQYNEETSFKGWLRRIMINTCIDLYRKEVKHYQNQNMESVAGEVTTVTAIDDLSHQELIALVQDLSPAYRTVFNLYVIDGYAHKEIADLLKISEGTSKSNLLKAREILKKKIIKANTTVYAKSIG